MTPNPWTEERKLKLKQWWLLDHLTAVHIARLFTAEGFSTTKNAVIGAVHRSDWWETGLSRTKTPPRPKKPEGWRKKLIDKTVKKLKKQGVYDQLEVVVITEEPPPPPPVKLRTPPEKPAPKPTPGQPMYLSVVQIGYDQCRYWYGDCRAQAGRKNETGYCGHKVSAGHRSWCDQHLKLVYAKGPRPVAATWIQPHPRMPGGGLKRKGWEA